jgi:hypothetical protein
MRAVLTNFLMEQPVRASIRLLTALHMRIGGIYALERIARDCRQRPRDRDGGA